MKISRNFKLEIAQKIQYEDCFFTSQEHHFALQVLKKNQMSMTLQTETTIDRSKLFFENSRVRVSAEEIDEKSEQKIFFEVTDYENDVERQKFDKIINEFSNI
jgi:hypothetical protein